MHSVVKVATLALVVLGSGTPLRAQGNALLGKWSVEYERGRRIENGEATVMRGSGTLTIVQSGDSLLATLEPKPEEGQQAPASTMGGRLTSGGAVFVRKQVVTINMNGEESQRPITVTWTLSASGDELSGSISRDMQMGGGGSPPPAPVKGKRIG